MPLLNHNTLTNRIKKWSQLFGIMNVCNPINELPGVVKNQK